MSEVSNIHTGISMQSNVTHVEVLKVYKGPSIESNVTHVEWCQKCIQGPSIQSNVTHGEGVESSSIYTIRAVMLCMSKVSKEAQNGFTHLCS